MILINLLPPELRKRTGNIDPMMFAAAGAAAASFIFVAAWAYIAYASIPAAEAYLAAKEGELAEVTARADQVKKIKDQIADITKQRDTVAGLVQKKFYWARTLDDFANALTGPEWPREGFEARCTELAIQPKGPAQQARGGGAAPGETVETIFKAKFKLVGKEENRSGVYLRNFFTQLEQTPFWRQHGFVGRAEFTYRGDSKVWSKDVSRVTIELPLEFVRAKTIAAKPGPRTAGN